MSESDHILDHVDWESNLAKILEAGPKVTHFLSAAQDIAKLLQVQAIACETTFLYVLVMYVHVAYSMRGTAFVIQDPMPSPNVKIGF